MPEITKKYTTGNSRYKAGQTFKPVGVVLHSIGTPQPNASVLWNYWQNNGSAYVTHYVLDDHQIIQCMPENYKCWHVGSPGNAKWIGVEMCEPKQIHYTSGAKFTVFDLGVAQKFVKACYTNAVWLLANICKRYGWNPETAILTHGEISKKKLSNTDHVDPEHLWNGLCMGYSLYQLRKDVAAAMGKQASTPAASTPVNNSPSSGSGKVDSAKSYSKSLAGTYRVTASALNVRSGAGTNKSVLATIPNGTKVQNYGYYTTVSGVKWLYIAFTYNGKNYEGFASGAYLKK